MSSRNTNAGAKVEEKSPGDESGKKIKKFHKIKNGIVNFHGDIQRINKSRDGNKPSLSKDYLICLNGILNCVGKLIGQQAQKLLYNQKNNTLNTNTVNVAARLLFLSSSNNNSTPESSLYYSIVKYQNEALKYYSNNGDDKSKRSLKEKANLNFPVKTKGMKFLLTNKSTNNSSRVYFESYIAFSAILDYLCSFIIEKTEVEANNANKKKLTVHFLSDAIKNNVDLIVLFNKNNIIIPGVHNLQSKIGIHKTLIKKMCPSKLKYIKRVQKGEEYFEIPKALFRRKFFDSIPQNDNGKRVSGNAVIALQTFCEIYLIKWFSLANLFCLETGKTGVTIKHLKAANKILYNDFTLDNDDIKSKTKPCKRRKRAKVEEEKNKEV